MSFFKSIAAPIAAVGAICGIIAVTAADANAEAGGRIACEVRETDRNGRQYTTAEYGRLDFYPGDKKAMIKPQSLLYCPTCAKETEVSSGCENEEFRLF